MRKNKLISAGLAATVVMSVLCCGCTKTTETTRKPKDGNDTDIKIDFNYNEELPEDETLIITGHRNEAWGHYSYLTFIQSDGSVYVSEESFEGRPQYYNGGITTEERVALLKKYTKPLMTIDEADIKEIYHYMLKIDPDAEFEYEDEYACDAGTGFTYVYVDGKRIQISESGDRTGELNDRNAKKVEKLIRKAFENRPDYNQAHVYSATDTFLDTFKCTNSEAEYSRKIITDINDLRRFEQDTGIDLLSLESFEYYGHPEYDSFRDTCIAVEIFDYHVKYEPVEADAFIVSDDYVGFASLEDPEVDMSINQAPTATYCYVAILPSYDPDDLARYDVFLNGN